MRRALGTAMAVLALAGCELTGLDDDDDDDFEHLLRVTARSSTTLTLEWDAMGTSNTYTVDFLTGVARCEDMPQHTDGQHVTGTSVRLILLTPTTPYHIHVHPLPHGTPGEGEVTNAVLVSTLAPGAAEQSVSADDYDACEANVGS
jgi:hypothetical protein